MEALDTSSGDKNRQVVRSADVVFNEPRHAHSGGVPHELRIVTFADVTPSYGYTMHTRAVLQSAASLAPIRLLPVLRMIQIPWDMKVEAQIRQPY